LVNLVAETLVKAGGFLIWPEKTDEGVLQPYVLDLTTILNNPRVFSRVALGLLKMIEKKIGLRSFDLVTGVPLAGVPYASYVSIKTGKPMLLVREGKKDRLEGSLKMGDRVLIIDDFVITGRQILRTASKIISEGGVVEQAVVIVCQSKSALERIGEKGIRLHYLIDFKSIVESLRKLDALSESEYETLLAGTKA
jgi:orotate phosphoribosyltransferase